MFESLINHDVVAVGLSGGGDSMALTHMLCLWAQNHHKHIHAIHVDHGLRNDSAAEANQVAQWISQFPCLQFTKLEWDHDNPDSSIMEKARAARYALMADYCQENNIQTLCIAHHADDQMETFFFRLAKGSGLDGLTGMDEVTTYNDTLDIYRPLLSLSHDDLISYCDEHDLQWIEDPSNENDKYARPRLRKALSHEGLSHDRFVKTLTRLSRAQDAIHWIVNNALKECYVDGVFDFQTLITYPIDIQIRSLQYIIQKVGNVTHHYPPKLERIESIMDTLRPNKSATLHGCVLTLSKDGNTLEIKQG